MKLVSLLTRIAVAGLVVATLGLALNALALVFFAGATSTLVLLIATSDYAPRSDYCTALVAVRTTESRPLAA